MPNIRHVENKSKHTDLYSGYTKKKNQTIFWARYELL